MRNIVIDTCVIIHIVRDTPTGKKCLRQLASLDSDPNIIISVATKAELDSFGRQNSWGDNKLAKLTTFLQAVTVIDIKAADKKLIEGYGQIDGYSKGKLPDSSGSLMSGSARKMGKNDLWIAATALAIDVSLVTTDGDFDHLHGSFIDVIKIV
ncbi:PIN domain-containing protein [Agriterribacter sp.]|uniref:PIN domain-containing protein n=1 Tax=Agriterribacter sp. TaxID=2821509 RepID=UPI002CCFBA73|nr:PIN domain-containing protein [Agriterribacter sp.]HRO45342.1 PIN domain-containing protein [Agriterribacter sp.]HRQ17097.1 PIN domain-containing protein [Agriterribacter sp.]